jgi:hypothetical protein
MRLQPEEAAQEDGRANGKKEKTTTKTTTNDGQGRTTDVGKWISLNSNASGYGDTNDDGGNNNKESLNNVTKGWFRGLVALVTGQEVKSATIASDDKENKLIPKRTNKKGNKNSYREQAKEFLRRTERKRTMMKDQCMQANNLHSIQQSRRLTGSATLQSIASCSNNNNNDKTTSSDNGSD